MLVLTRKPGEKIRIGGSIVVTLIDIGRGRARIGIDAPRVIEVLREELHRAEPAEGGGAEHG
jgi:carbon storage regulator